MAVKKPTTLKTKTELGSLDSPDRALKQSRRTVTQAVTTRNGRWFTVRSMPYRTQDMESRPVTP